MQCFYFLIRFILVQTHPWDQLSEAAEVSEELLSPASAVGKGMHSTCAWGSFQPLFLQGKLSPDVLGKTEPRLFDGSSEMQAGASQAIWAVLSVGYFPSVSLSPRAEIITSMAPK